MHLRKKTLGKRNPAPTASEAELAVYRLLVTARPTPKECRLVVRHLLREASRNLERKP